MLKANIIDGAQCASLNSQTEEHEATVYTSHYHDRSTEVDESIMSITQSDGDIGSVNKREIMAASENCIIEESDPTDSKNQLF
ncbi:hypothetical protein LIER_39001 [Lithospermum erythrorhizon]|uniref:Uncharacterized protein n=1 Tax=Lithospermum erythrorhizon TaxID=34254 RepID=A0AAV3Q8F1_LITER